MEVDKINDSLKGLLQYSTTGPPLSDELPLSDAAREFLNSVEELKAQRLHERSILATKRTAAESDSSRPQPRTIFFASLSKFLFGSDFKHAGFRLAWLLLGLTIGIVWSHRTISKPDATIQSEHVDQQNKHIKNYVINKFNNTSNWISAAVDGDWVKDGSELVQNNSSGLSAFIFGDNRWKDYDFTVDAMRTSGTDAFALLFRCDKESKSYAFVVSSGVDSLCFVEVCTAEKRLRFTKPISYPVENKKWYTARIRIRSDNLQCFIKNADGNETKIGDVNTSIFPGGFVGLRTEGSTYRFTNLKVTDPSGKVLWSGTPQADPSVSLIADEVRPGSVWSGRRWYRKGAYKGQNVEYHLHIDDRSGKFFDGHVFDNGANKNRAEVKNGEIVGNYITWQEVTPLAETTVRGVLEKDSIRLTFVGEIRRSINSEGEGKLDLVPGNENPGR